MTKLSQAIPVAHVIVTDRERGVAWYRDTLGLEHRTADEFGDFFGWSSGLLRLTAMPDHRPSGHPVLGWHVGDIHAAVAELKARGVAMTIYEGMGQDTDGIWAAPGSGTKVAWFADCDGNCLSLSQG